MHHSKSFGGGKKELEEKGSPQPVDPRKPTLKALTRGKHISIIKTIFFMEIV